MVKSHKHIGQPDDSAMDIDKDNIADKKDEDSTDDHGGEDADNRQDDTGGHTHEDADDNIAEDPMAEDEDGCDGKVHESMLEFEHLYLQI